VVDEVLEGSPESSPEDQAEARDAAAFPRVVAAHHDDMARVAFVVIGLPKSAQDAVQSAWAGIWRERTTLESPKRLRAWVLGMSAKAARSLADAGFGQSQAGGESGAPVTQAASAPAYKSDELALVNALTNLDAHDRMILGLRWVGGLDADQIGVELSMPGNAVLARVARILNTWLKDPGFAAPPTVTLEQYERELAARLRSLADRAVVTIDPAVIAKIAIETVPAATLTDQVDARLQELIERVRAVDRKIWLAAGGVVVAAFLLLSFLGGQGGVAVATPVPSDATRLCERDEIDARVTDWQSVGDARLGTVEVHNLTGGACLLDGAPEPWLVDGANNAIIKGQDLAADPVRLGPGQTLRTRIHVANYCGPEAEPPVTIAFWEGGSVIFARPLNGNDVGGVPPCTTRGGPATFWMEAWSL
jgi:DNA-directed RNA polymerase specialized sigma24 family protein